MTRDEHLAECKRRAREYLDMGDVKNGVTSMLSDLSERGRLRHDRHDDDHGERPRGSATIRGGIPMNEPRRVMKLHPFDQCVAAADTIMQRGGNVDIYQQWNCEHCGAKQTMENPNQFHISGICEECGKETDIKKNGCNYMIHAQGPQAVDAVLKQIRGEKP
jgi:hypothetical protein